jgi:hypothetical protein
MRAEQTRLVPGDVRCPKGFLHGGASYLVGPKALDALCKAPVQGFSEDGWSSNTIAAAGLKSVHDSRFAYVKRIYGDPIIYVPAPDNDLIAGGELISLSDGRSELYAVHKKFQGGEE